MLLKLKKLLLFLLILFRWHLAKSKRYHSILFGEERNIMKYNENTMVTKHKSYSLNYNLKWPFCLLLSFRNICFIFEILLYRIETGLYFCNQLHSSEKMN